MLLYIILALLCNKLAVLNFYWQKTGLDRLMAKAPGWLVYGLPGFLRGPESQKNQREEQVSPVGSQERKPRKTACPVWRTDL